MSIGILVGNDPWSLVDDDRHSGPIVSADGISDAAFVADPFAVRHQGTWHLFFEIMDRRTGKGEIGLASSSDLHDWVYRGKVLVEPFHLSYPAVYEVDGTFWMIPETWESKQVRLYRADEFPRVWTLDRILLDVPGTDPTLFRLDDGSWMMLLCDADGPHNSTLLAYRAPAITGPWTLAPESPLVAERSDQARPGGPVFTWDGCQYRLGQDCSSRYGESLRSYPLVAPWSDGGRDVLRAAGPTWRARGGHHADFHRLDSGELIAFVDGEA